MQLVLAEILALAAAGGYEVNAALSDESAALILSAAVLLADPDNWEGASYILTTSETDTIDNMVANMIDEVMTQGWEPGNGEAMSVAVIADQKTLGTNGGTFTSGAWRVRDLNTKLCDPDTIVSVVDNQFTLPAGTYFILASAPAYRTNYHKVRLWDDTAEEEVELGTSETSNVSDATMTRSWVATILTLESEADFELQHICNYTYANTGFGRAGSLAAEIYAQVVIVKVD